MDSAQLYKNLLTEAIRKQMMILGPQITFLKIHNVPELMVTDDGNVVSLGPHPEETVTRFLEQFRDLSAPLVKKTMQQLLNAVGAFSNAAITSQPHVVQSQTNQANQGQSNQFKS